MNESLCMNDFKVRNMTIHTYLSTVSVADMYKYPKTNQYISTFFKQIL